MFESAPSEDVLWVKNDRPDEPEQPEYGADLGSRCNEQNLLDLLLVRC
jgi:hypothetical protein